MKKLLLVLSTIILSELGYAQHTLVLNPVSDCYVETYGGGVGKNSFFKFDITTIPSGTVLTNTKLRTFVTNILPGWDGDLKLIHYSNQTWIEGDSNKFIWQPIYFVDTLTQLFGFGTMPGWAETIDINSFLDIDYQASNIFFSVLLKDIDDPTCCPNLSGVSKNDNDSMMIGNIFNDNIVFRPKEWVNSTPELVIDYGIPPTVLPVLPVSPVCENSSVAFSISVTGDAPFAYQWQINGVDIAGANTTTYTLASAQLTDAGNYTCIVTNAYGSDVSDIIALIVNTVPLISVTSINVTCNGGFTGSIDMTVTSGTPSYTYSWSNGVTTEDISGLNAGIFNPTVTDANGCTTTASVTITEPSAIVVTASHTNITCNGLCDGTATINVSGGSPPYSFVWNTGASNNTINSLCAGIYCCTITDINSCSTTKCVNITQPNELTITHLQTNVTCNGLCDGTATLNVTGGSDPYSCLWSNGAIGNPITNLCPGIYSSTITDGNGCIATTSVTITEQAVLSVSVSQTNVTCNGLCNGTATPIISGGTAPYSCFWSNGQTSINATNLCAGIFSVTVTDGNGCTATTSDTITQSATLSVSVLSQTNTMCNGTCNGTATITLSGGTIPYSINWSNGMSFNNITSTTSTVNGLCVGVYNVTLSDVNGCTATTSVTITEPSAIVVSVSQTNVKCNGVCDGSISISASGGSPSYTYLWGNANTDSSITDLCAGVFCYTVTDSNGCIATSCVTITQPPQINLSTTQTNTICNGSCDGTATVSANNGVSPYIYLWTNSSTSDSVYNLCSGVYCCTVTDSHTCTSTVCVTITQPIAIIVSVSQINVTCNGLCDGIATITPTGGATPYNYIWSTGQTGATITNLCAGTYCCTITDFIGCTITSCVTITEPDELIVSVLQTNVTCNGLCDGTVTINTSGGTPSYTYILSTGGDWWNLCAGNYYVTVIDANACTITVAFSISEPAPLDDIISSTDDNSTNNGTATINVIGGTPSFTFLWDDILTQNTLIATGLSFGWYHVTATDINGCTITDSVEVLLNTGIVSEKFTFNCTLFPNPANTEINLNISSNRNEEIMVIVYNNISDIVLRKNILLETGENLHSFDLQLITPGIYFVKLQRSNEISYVKFVKN